MVVGQDVSDPASREAGESTTLFSSAGALEPPYDPAALCLLVEHSNALRQNLDAYAVNIDGFGHRLEPAIDFEAEDADARVADAIFLERSADCERGEFGAARLEMDPDGDFRTNLRGKGEIRVFTCGLLVGGFDIDEGMPMDLGKAVADAPELDATHIGGAP